MEIPVEKLSQAEEKLFRRMDGDDRTALKLCLLSVGALTGLSVRGTLARRALCLGCTILAAGLALPLAKEYMDQVEDEPAPTLAEVPAPPEERD